MAGFPCVKAVLIAVLVELLFEDIEGSVIKRQSDYAMYDYNFNRVGDTDLDNEVTDCGLVRHQYRKGYIRLREYIERIRGCGREGKMKNIEGIARSTMDGIREDEIKGIAAAAMEDININSNSDDMSQDGKINAVVKSSSSSIKPPINTASNGNVRLTSQPQQVQVQDPSYKAAPVVWAPAKPPQHNTFAHFTQINRPATNNRAVSTYNVPQMNNYHPVNEMPQIKKLYPNNGPGQLIGSERKFYYNSQNAPSRYAVQVGQPLHKPAAIRNLMNSFHQPILGRDPQRYFTQNNIYGKPSVTVQHLAPTQMKQINIGPKYQTKNMGNNNNEVPFLDIDSRKKAEPENKDSQDNSNNQNLSENLASLDSSVVDDKRTNKKQSSSSQNTSSIKMISGITTAMNNNLPSLARNSKNSKAFEASKNSDNSKKSDDSKNLDDSKNESLDVPVISNDPSAADQLDPVESNPDVTENEQGTDEKHTSPENLEVNLDALKEKIMHSTNATFLRRMLKLIRKITHHKDFNKLDSTGQNIVMKADHTIHALNTAYQQAQRDHLELSPPRDPPSMPPAINTDLMDDDVVTKKFQIERKPYQYQQRPLYNNPYYNLRRWQYGLYNGNTLD